MTHALRIDRPLYRSFLTENLNTPAVKVLSGVRRSGKSTLLRMLTSQLKQDGVPAANILYRSMDSFDVPLGADAAWLEGVMGTALSQRDAAWPLYVCLDEIQEIPGWERVIRRLHTDGTASIFLTGSNAFLLSSDLATYLSGRYIELPVWPLSFAEYLAFSKAHGDDALGIDALFARYVRYGGMPGLFEKNDFTPEHVNRELTAIHDTVILNDVARRFELRDADPLEKLVRYVYTTSGGLFSTRKVAGPSPAPVARPPWQPSTLT